MEFVIFLFAILFLMIAGLSFFVYKTWREENPRIESQPKPQSDEENPATNDDRVNNS